MKLIPLLIFKNHWLLYDDDIVYRGKKYNTFRFLKQLIKERILKRMTINEKSLIKSNCEVYLKTPTEIRLSEFDDKLFEFKQYDDITGYTRNSTVIFYCDFECTTDRECHEPYLYCINKRGSEGIIKTFQGKDYVKQLMYYLFINFKRSTIIFYNLVYDNRLVHRDINVDKALEKGQ